MRPLWEELSDSADALAVAGKLDMPALRLMRAAAVQMQNWFVANEELREEVAQLKAYRNARAAAIKAKT